MTAVCAYPGCEVIDQPPYRGKRDMPSVTGVTSLIDDGKAASFGYAGSLIAATFAVHYPDTWAHLGTEGCAHIKEQMCPACKYLRHAHKVEWDARAAIGSHVHHLAESWARGDEVDQDEVTEPYLNAIEAFYEKHNPDWDTLEATVLYDKSKAHAYRGKFDGIVTLDCPECTAGDTPARCRYLVDWKTGRYYPAEQTLQLSAYRHAGHLTRWEKEGSKQVEIKERPVPAVAHTAVVLVGNTGEFRLCPLPANGDAHATFLRLRDLHGWLKQMRSWEKDNPITDIDRIRSMVSLTDKFAYSEGEETAA